MAAGAIVNDLPKESDLQALFHVSHNIDSDREAGALKKVTYDCGVIPTRSMPNCIQSPCSVPFESRILEIFCNLR